MTDLQAALGIHQVARLAQGAKRREEIWARYDQAFADLPVIRPAPIEAGTVHARHLYTILVKAEELARTRDWVLNELLRWKIGTGVHYTALHLHPYYRQTFGYQLGDFPNAEYIGARTLSLPLSAKLSDQDVEDVVAAVRAVTQRPV
jgi:dTDP-4-amino-4,6-dideoxygalactose transaminase